MRMTLEYSVSRSFYSSKHRKAEQSFTKTAFYTVSLKNFLKMLKEATFLITACALSIYCRLHLACKSLYLKKLLVLRFFETNQFFFILEIGFIFMAEPKKTILGVIFKFPYLSECSGLKLGWILKYWS